MWERDCLFLTESFRVLCSEDENAAGGGRERSWEWLHQVNLKLGGTRPNTGTEVSRLASCTPPRTSTRAPTAGASYRICSSMDSIHTASSSKSVLKWLWKKQSQAPAAAQHQTK